jgi:hypothetical protein
LRGWHTAQFEILEPRLVLDASGFPGNDCPPDLDLSGLTGPTVMAGEPFTLDLLAQGAMAIDRDASQVETDDVLRFQLDPDIPEDTPLGASITSEGVFTWTPTLQQVGTHRIVVILVDQGSPPLADSETFTIEVLDPAAANQIPFVDLNGATAGTGFLSTYTEGGFDTRFVSVDARVVDADDTMLVSARAVLTNRPDGEFETLGALAGNTSITPLWDPTTGVLSLTGPDTVANFQEVIRSLTYRNTSQDPDAIERLVEVTVDDGTDESVPAVATIGVVAVNDPPDLLPIDNRNALVGQLLQIPVLATDVDDPAVTITLDRDDPQASIPALATIESTGSNTAIISWTPTAADGPGPFTFVVLATDMNATDPLTDRQQFTVSLQDTTPSVDLNGPADGLDFAATFVEDGGPVAIVSDQLSVTDSNDTVMDSAIITITNRPDGEAERLAVVTQSTGLLQLFLPDRGILAISGDAPLATYEQVLRTLTYENTSQNPDLTDRVITVTVFDGANTSPAANAVVSMVAQDDAPEVQLPAPFDNETTPVPIDVGQLLTFTATAVDPDSPGDEVFFILDLDNSGIPAAAAQPSITTPPLNVPGGVFTWTPDTSGTFEIVVLVIDLTGKVDTERFVVEVSDVSAQQANAQAATAERLTDDVLSDEGFLEHLAGLSLGSNRFL